MIKILGTSHVAKQSLKEIEKYIEDNQPDIVAVELDRNRLTALLHNQKKQHLSIKEIRNIGFTGFIFASIGSYVQNKIGKLVEVNPGEDMLTAVKLAKQHNLKIALIDQNIKVTLQKISKSFKFTDLFKLFVDGFNGLFFKERELKKYGLNEIDFNKVPSKKVIKKVINGLSIRYPNLYKVLVHERNIYMVRNLVNIQKHHPDSNILAVVGAGHEDGMLKILETFK